MEAAGCLIQERLQVLAHKITIGEQCLSIPSSYLGLDSEQLSWIVEQPKAEIVGADILNNFDIRIDTKIE